MSSQPRTGAVVFARNISAVAQFYEQVVGAQVTHAADDHIVLVAGPLQLVVHAMFPAVKPTREEHSPPALRDGAAIKLFFQVSSLTAARATAASLGGGLAPPEKEWVTPDFRVCDGWDPEGNVVQFREYAA